MAEAILERSQRKQEELWALEDLYPTDEAWEADLKILREKIAQVPSYAGRLGESAQTLYDYMQLDETIGLLLDNLANYAQRRSDEDTRVAKYQAMTDRITAVWVEAASSSSFETPELLAISDETLERFYEEKRFYPLNIL